MQNNPRTEFEGRHTCIAITMAWPRHVRAARPLRGSGRCPSGPPPRCHLPTGRHARTQLRLEVRSPSSWSLQNENEVGPLPVEERPFLLPSGTPCKRLHVPHAPSRQPQASPAGSAGSVPWPQAGGKGPNTCSLSIHRYRVVLGARNGVSYVMTNISLRFLLLSPFAQVQEG